MATVAEQHGESASPEVQIQRLRERGFQFIDPRDERGDVVAVVGVRAHDNVIDVVRLHGEDDVVASRMPSDDDILAPRRVFWQRAGSACEVLAGLLALPDDRTPGSVPVAARSRCR
jgi:hypothetical protein